MKKKAEHPPRISDKNHEHSRNLEANVDESSEVEISEEGNTSTSPMRKFSMRSSLYETFQKL